MVGGSTPRIFQAVVLGSLLSKWGNKKLGLLIARPNKEDLSHVAGLVEGGRLAPVIERSYTLVEAPEALSRVGEGRALGKIVIPTGIVTEAAALRTKIDCHPNA